MPKVTDDRKKKKVGEEAAEKDSRLSQNELRGKEGLKKKNRPWFGWRQEKGDDFSGIPPVRGGGMKGKKGKEICKRRGGGAGTPTGKRFFRKFSLRRGN